MIIAVEVLFRLADPLSLEEATAKFESTAPNYRGKVGLLSKAYLRSEDGAVAGGFYLWDSREAAEAQYTDSWRATVAEVYGTQPEVHYYEVPVFIQNAIAVETSGD